MPAFQCSKCGKALEEIGVPPQIQFVQMFKRVVNIGSEQVPEEIKNDPFLYRGFYCSACNKVFCPRCSNMQSEICPACDQRRLMPAYRPLLKKLNAPSTSSTATERKRVVGSIKVVPLWIIPFFLLFTLNLYNFFWLYRVFKELHVRKATDLSPGKAVGYMFIPFFNLGWIFVAWKKLGDAITAAYSRTPLTQPAAGVVWLAPISLFVAVALDFAAPLLGTAVAVVLLSVALCTIQGQMNRLAATEIGNLPLPSEEATGQLKMWAASIECANSLCNDHAFLFGALMHDGSPQARAFLDAMGKSKRLVTQVNPSPKGGFDVLLSLQ